jgi:hypothetical protein
MKKTETIMKTKTGIKTGNGIKIKRKGKVVPMLFFLTEHHAAMKAYWGVEV